MTAHLCVADSFSFLTNLLNNATTNLPDLMLAPGLGVHRSLLASLSPLLNSILHSSVSDLPFLILPHVEANTVERLVQLVYNGSCSVAYSEMPNLLQLLEDLDLAVVLKSLSLGTKVKQVEKRTSRTNEELVDININDGDGVSVVVLEDLTEECEVCRKKFKAGEELGFHFVKEHCFKQNSSMFESGEVQCIRCDKMFNDRDLIKLLEHIGHDHRELLENGSLEKANNCVDVEVNENISPFKECDNVNRNTSEVGDVHATGGDIEFEESANNDETAVAMFESGANEESAPPNAGFELDVINVETEVNVTGNTVINNDSFVSKEANGVNRCDIINDDTNVIAGYQHELVENVSQLLSSEEGSGRAMNDNTNSNNKSRNEQNISPIKESVNVGAAAVNGESVIETEESAVADENSTLIIGFKISAIEFERSNVTGQCDCAKEDDDTPACGPRCINRSTRTECDPQVCVNEERCMNMVIQKKQYVPGLERFMTKDKGWGVRPRQRVPKGTFIMEYTGEVCSSKEYERRLLSKYKEDDHKYCLALNSKTVIDAHRAGSECRFVNHSCDPNCRMDKWIVAGRPRMALFSLRDISPGEEICYDY